VSTKGKIDLERAKFMSMGRSGIDFVAFVSTESKKLKSVVIPREIGSIRMFSKKKSSSHKSTYREVERKSCEKSFGGF